MSHINANIWLALRDDAQDKVKERLTWDTESQGEYSGPVTDRSAKLFRYMQQHKEKLFRAPTLGGRVYTVWSITFSVHTDAAQKIKDELDFLIATYPTQVFVTGAWRWEEGDMACRQIGTQLVISTRIVEKTWSELNPDYQPDPLEPDFDDRYVLRVTGDVEEEYVSGSLGTPTYPLHPQLLKFMPDVNELPATELADTNLLMGQPPRNFL